MSLKSSVVVVTFGVCSAFVGTVLAEDVGSDRAADEKLVKALTTNQVAQFQGYVQAKNLRNQEFIVCGRIVNEKRNELNILNRDLEKEFGVSPDKSYHFEGASKKLYELSTNSTDKVKGRDRKLVREAKSESEAQMIRKMMLSRRLTEQQVAVLLQLREEKMKEFSKIDAKLRETFGLDPKARYRLDSDTGKLFLVEKKSDKGVAQAKGGVPAPVQTAPVKAKK